MPPLLSEEESVLDPYALLALENSATEKDVRKAYRQMSRNYHPDRNPTPEAAIMFRKISLALEILVDPAKRSYVDTKLEGERRRAEKYAASDKKRKEMIDALVAREEEAKKAKLAHENKRRQAAEEEEIKEAGKKMLAEAQKRAQESAELARREAKLSRDAAVEQRNPGAQPEIRTEDLTLLLSFPPESAVASSSRVLQDTLFARYGGINHVLMKEPKAVPEKKVKKKGKKVVVEFKEGNWGGCWACWKDHADGASATGREVESGVKAKWAAGSTPDWVEWAEKQSTNDSNGTRHTTSEGHSNQYGNGSGNGNGNGYPNDLEEAGGWSIPTPTHQPVFSFDSAPDFGGTSMEELLSQHGARKEAKAAAKKRDDEFESMTLLKMRQMERQRMEEQIRREEADEEAAA